MDKPESHAGHNRKNLRKLTIKVTPQTAYNLHRLADMGNIPVGRVVDKLVRDRMVTMKEAVRNG